MTKASPAQYRSVTWSSVGRGGVVKVKLGVTGTPTLVNKKFVQSASRMRVRGGGRGLPSATSANFSTGPLLPVRLSTAKATEKKTATIDDNIE
jgi:hypothetical protein